MKKLPDALKPLGTVNQFVLWKPVPSTRRPGKFDKFPCDITGRKADAHDPNNWLSFEQAAMTAELLGEEYHVGFVLTENDPFWFLDIDNCASNGQWSDLAIELMNRFGGCAIEVSHSGSGLHLIGKYSIDEPEHAKKNIPLHLELYTSYRFIALTGNHATGDAGYVYNDALTQTIQQYFPFEKPVNDSTAWTTGPVEGYKPIEDDDELITAAKKAAGGASSVFGGKAKFADLWDRNVDVLSKSYPSDSNDTDYYDESLADMALASHLIFWTSGDCERTERLMRSSALYRPKWDNHRTYLRELTITRAFSGCREFFGKKPDSVVPPKPHEIVETDYKFREGFQLVDVKEQIKYFDGCVYIADQNRIFTPSGMFMKPEQFNAMYGGYHFQIDPDVDKTSKKAWEVFTESMVTTFPKAESSCFRPELPAGTIIREEGLRLVNTYIDVKVESMPGDVSPFLNHLTKMLPDERDREIILSYMAACIQQKGHKIQWAPVIQGVKGNGKTLISLVLIYAVGERYSHMPRADEISEKFNAWLFNKLFIGVEEIKVTDKKLEILEVLKPMITSGRLARRAMQTDQVMTDVCANFVFTTNHKDAIPMTTDERRYAIFYTAQQRVDDLVRDGMDGSYFPDLYDWLRSEGYAKITHFLQNYQIKDEFNPKTMAQRAPATSSSTDAITMSLGSVEQEVMEAIDEEREGFRGGWVSSFALDKLIDDLRKTGAVPRNRRREIMHSLGYEYHPGLRDGRVNNAIPREEGKPRLYIKSGHIHANLSQPADIARHYMAAQGYLMGVDKAVS